MDKPSSYGVPQSIVLATDLTPSCDRALERAVRLARDWKAKLTVVHVVETSDKQVVGVARRTKYAEAEMAQQIQSCCEGENLPIEPRITFGDPVERLLVLARECGCDLMVVGLAHAKSLGEKLLGSTTVRLVRDARFPVLTVRDRPYGSYGSVAVGIDFSEASRQAVGCALALFPQSAIWLVHAYDIPFDGDLYSGFALNELESGRKSAVDMVLEEAMSRFIAKGGGAHRAVQTFHWHGKADAVFSTFIDIHQPDLVVLGTHGRSGFRRLMLGSVTERLLNVLPCDVLVVPLRQGGR